MKHYFFGDTHHNIDMRKISLWEPSDKKKSNVYILGDWGGLWYPNNEKNYAILKRWIKLQNKKNFQLFVIPGNHENYTLINSLPEKVIKDENNCIKVKELRVVNPWTNQYKGTIYILKNGIHKIDGKNILAVRGAVSIDRIYRTRNLDWWEEEVLSKKEEDEIIKKLENFQGKFDYILTHTCPSKIVDEILGNKGKAHDSVAVFLQHIYDEYLKNRFDLWLFGHFHEDVEIEYNSDTFIGLYNYTYVEDKELKVVGV